MAGKIMDSWLAYSGTRPAAEAGAAPPRAVQRLVHRLLVPTPGRYLLDALDVPPVTAAGIPASYVLARDDLALARPGAELAARVGAEPVLVPGGHEALLTHPDAVAQAVLTA